SVDDQSVLRYRRKLGWIVVIISLLVGTYKLITHILPFAELKENVLTLIGVSFFILMTLFYTYIIYGGPARAKHQSHGN
ncbi:MAG: hypothetical protein V4560_00180, partial [Bacteroidota bacterium]